MRARKKLRMLKKAARLQRRIAEDTLRAQLAREQTTNAELRAQLRTAVDKLATAVKANPPQPKRSEP